MEWVKDNLETIKAIFLWLDQFSQTAWGIFTIQVIGVFFACEIVRLVAKEVLKEVLKLPAKKERLLYLFVGLSSNVFLGSLASWLINYGHGFRKVTLLSLGCIVVSLVLHYGYLAWKEKKKQDEINRKILEQAKRG